MKQTKNQNLINYEATISTNKIAKKDIQQENKFKEQNQKVFDKFPQLKDNPAFSESEPAHFKLYIADISALSAISRTAENLLLAIINQGDLVGFKGTFPINPEIKSILNESMNSKDKKNSGINKALLELQEPIQLLNNSPILLEIEKYKYDPKNTQRFMINPFLMGSGSWDNILNKRLRVTLDYDFSLNSRKLTIEELTEEKEINSGFLDKLPEPPKEPESSIFDDFDEEIQF